MGSSVSRVIDNLDFCQIPLTSKDPGPEGPALGYPWKGFVYI